MPEKFYIIKNKSWNYQGGAIENKTKEKIRYNINLRLKQLNLIV